MRISRLSVAAVAGAALIAGAAFAASHGANPAIGARKAQMALQGFNVGQLASMAKGETPYDAAVAATLAEDMVALSGMLSGPALSLYFPEGTAAGEAPDTRAKAEIWSDRAGFQAEADKFRDATVALAAAASTDLASLQAALGPVGASCGSCHQGYRVPNN